MYRTENVKNYLIKNYKQKQTEQILKELSKKIDINLLLNILKKEYKKFDLSLEDIKYFENLLKQELKIITVPNGIEKGIIGANTIVYLNELETNNKFFTQITEGTSNSEIIGIETFDVIDYEEDEIHKKYKYLDNILNKKIGHFFEYENNKYEIINAWSIEEFTNLLLKKDSSIVAKNNNYIINNGDIICCKDLYIDEYLFFQNHDNHLYIKIDGIYEPNYSINDKTGKVTIMNKNDIYEIVNIINPHTFTKRFNIELNNKPKQKIKQR